MSAKSPKQHILHTIIAISYNVAIRWHCKKCNHFTSFTSVLGGAEPIFNVKDFKVLSYELQYL